MESSARSCVLDGMDLDYARVLEHAWLRVRARRRRRATSSAACSAA
jgi:hypothetical protein